MIPLPGLWALALMLLATGGCASAPVAERLGEPPANPYWRIAVLPAASARPPDGGKAHTFEPDTLERARECLALHLPRDRFSVVPLPRVNAALRPGEPFQEDPGEIVRIARALDARVLVLPELFSWDRDYYLLHSVARVGLRVSLFDGETGEPLFRASRENVRNQGILKVPVGYGGAIYGPIRGILDFQMGDLCNRVSGEIAEDLAAFARPVEDQPVPDAPSPTDTPPEASSPAP